MAGPGVDSPGTLGADPDEDNPGTGLEVGMLGTGAPDSGKDCLGTGPGMGGLETGPGMGSLGTGPDMGGLGTGPDMGSPGTGDTRPEDSNCGVASPVTPAALGLGSAAGLKQRVETPGLGIRTLVGVVKPEEGSGVAGAPVRV